MLRRWARRGLLILGLGCTWGVDAWADEPSGDPLASPIGLAGTWYALAEDLTPEQATIAVVERGHAIELPGTFVGTKLEGHHGITWYGLDIALSTHK